MFGQKKSNAQEGPRPPAISIIGPGVEIKGDLVSPGSLRIEGAVQGSVYAAKGIVVGREGTVTGDIATQDAVIAGRLEGTLRAASRVEVHASARIDGEVHSRSVQVQEGARLNGQVRMDDSLTLDAHPGLGLGVAQEEEVTTAESPNGTAAAPLAGS